MEHAALRDQLEGNPDALALFERLVQARANEPDEPAIMEITYGNGTSLIAGSYNLGDIRSSSLNDLVDHGLLRVTRYGSRGDRVLEVSSGGMAFNRWLQSERGAPIERVVQDAIKLVDGPAFARACPSAAKHLEEAFALLVADRLDVPALTELGTHLRSALIDAVATARGNEQPDEDVERATKATRKAAAERGDDATMALVDLARAVLRLDHGVTHNRDEQHQGRPIADLATAHRAAYLTAVCCYELVRSPIR